MYRSYRKRIGDPLPPRERKPRPSETDRAEALSVARPTPPVDSIAMTPRRRPLRARPDRDELLRRPGRARRGRGGRRSTRATTRPTLRLELARMGVDRRRDPRHAHPLRPHRRRRRPRRGDGCARLRLRGRGAGARAARPTTTRASRSAPCEADVLLAGDETIELAGISFETVAGARPLAGPPRVLRGRLPLLRRRPLRRLGRPHRPADGDWDTLVESIRTLVDRFPPETVVYSGHGPPTTLGDELARNPFLAELRARERSRRREGRTTSSRPSSRAGAQVTEEFERLCALYGYRRIDTPVFEDTELFARTSGRGLGRRLEGDVHVHRPRRPLADAARRGDGADRARLPRARPAPRAAAGEALHDRDDLPLRAAAEGPLPRALAARRRGDRLRRPGGRRRGDPALRRAARPARHRRSTGSS